MRISTLVSILEEIQEEHGDLTVHCQDPHTRSPYKTHRWTARDFIVKREHPEDGGRVIFQMSV